MKYSPTRIIFGNIEDIPEVALIGTVEIAELKPEIHVLGETKFAQRIINKRRIKVTNLNINEDVPFKYAGKVATIDEFLERINDYLVSREEFLAEVRDLHEGGRIFGHSICGVLYTLK